MSLQKKLQNIIMYQNKPYEPGASREKSNISQPKEVTEDTVSPIQTMNVKTFPLKKSSTLVFHLKNNKEISIDRSNFLKPDTQDISLSLTLEAELTSKEKGLNPFWRESSRELSKKLWLPKETDSQGLDLTYLNGFSHNITHSSFQIKPVQKISPKQSSQTTSWRSSLYSVPDTMVKESTRYSRKIRIYPTESHKHLFEKCFRATRYVWNNALDYIQKNPGTSLSHISLRQNTMLTDKQLMTDEHKHSRWLKDIPFDTRQLVLKQLASNFKTNFTLLKRKKITHFKMGFKSKKNPYQTFFVNKKALDLQTLRLFKRRTKEPLKVRNRMKKWISKHKAEGDFIIRREKNRYYLCLPMVKPSIQSKPMYNKVALDPGVRTFQTFYSDQGIAGKIGHSVCDSLIDIGLLEDKLKSKLKTIKKKRTRYNLKKRCFLLRSKIKNIVKDLHWKTCHFLCSTFKHILLPSFETSNMVRKDIPYKGRSIGSKTVRKMLALSHYAFKQRLLYKAESVGCFVEIVNEAYSTKGCGECGALKKMGSLKTYKCDHCSFVLDRDFNGSRNILLVSI